MLTYYSTEQPVIWFRDRYLAGELVLKPPFQRRPVWTVKQKCYLVESILLGLPIPELYVQHAVERANDGVVAGSDKAEKSVYYVVDGQQRIRTILQFLGVDKTESEQEWNKFSLDKLPTDSGYRDATFSTLNDADRGRLLKYKFAVRQLETDSDEVVRSIFKRINKFVTKLNDQELRNATYSGPFMQLAQALADDEVWVRQGLVSPAQIRRMKDVEFVSELVIGVIHGPQGGSARVIDDYYSQYEDYEDEFPNQRAVVKRFTTTLVAAKSVLDKQDFTRFGTNRTDFYTLFVAMSMLLLNHTLSRTEIPKLRATLLRFERAVDARLADETKSAPSHVISYVRSVEKGANDRKRRADRNAALLNVIGKHFKKQKAV
jgi:hypothetical protein